jgi:large subunit ribosomal protein L24
MRYEAKLKTRAKATTTKKFRKDDKVVVISGNNRGQIGNILRSIGDKVVIQGVNVRKKHVKPSQGNKGGIISIERPIHVSNIKLCVGENQGVKLRVKTTKQGHRELYYLDGKNEVTYRKIN